MKPYVAFSFLSFVSSSSHVIHNADLLRPYSGSEPSHDAYEPLGTHETTRSAELTLENVLFRRGIVELEKRCDRLKGRNDELRCVRKTAEGSRKCIIEARNIQIWADSVRFHYVDEQITASFSINFIATASNRSIFQHESSIPNFYNSIPQRSPAYLSTHGSQLVSYSSICAYAIVQNLCYDRTMNAVTDSSSSDKFPSIVAFDRD